MSQPNSDMADFDAPEFEELGGEAVPAAEAEVSAPPAPVQRYRKQGFNIYTVMLILSFICLLTAMVILFIEAGKYS